MINPGTYRYSKVQSIDGSEPITRADIKTLLDIDGTDYDDKIDLLITPARVFCENYTGLALIQKTVIDYHDCFPRVIELRFPFVGSITSVKYKDTDGAEQTFSSSKYITDLISAPARLEEAYGENWPTTRRMVNAVYIEYQTEATIRQHILQPVREAMALIIGRQLDCFSDHVKKMKFASENLLDQIRPPVL